MGVQYERASIAAGVSAVAVSLLAVVLATLVSPSFAWTSHALSNLGEPGHAVATDLTRLLFNSGLKLGGLLGLGFSYVLFVHARNPFEYVGVAAFVVSMLAMGAIGVFPAGTTLHFPAFLTFYGSLTAALLGFGVGTLLAGERERGLATILLAVVNVGSWVVWMLGGPLLRPGLAIPEFVVALVLGGWMLTTSTRYR
ncbi:DUF998 domain-containing protein [Haloarculaceae archaeon H-GB2-1]|nr:DUF998 domain-containing protein [Haloarculaceae archaeon H-GB1-1]MEA5386366.1 DUF998 domain-containing protein [Haloarculaceae archaeon H-GB11]MEA5407872.1 DUF998 domain-containing protein [Haloarculaceae archaeon H-GB2-1]